VGVGTLLLIEEDVRTTHARTLLKYFAAEGLACGQHVVFVSGDPGASSLVHTLPSSVELLPQEEDAEKQHQEDLKVAWQYQKYLKEGDAGLPRPPTKKAAKGTQASARRAGLTRTSSRKLKPFCHTYDLSRPMKTSDVADLLAKGKLEVCDAIQFQPEEGFIPGAKYRHFFHSLRKSLVLSGGIPDGKQKELSVTRIAINSLGSPSWLSGDQEDAEARYLVQFLHVLKGLLRSSLAVCTITIPSHLFAPSLLVKLRHIADGVVALHSFKGSGDVAGEAFKDYSGLFYLRKLPRLNSLVWSYVPDALTFLFQMRRRTFRIEEIHLPPEIDRSNATGDTKPSGAPLSGGNVDLLCAPGPTNQARPLDF